MDKLFGVIYGPVKSGKTRSAISGLPCSLCISAYDGLATAKWLGLTLEKSYKAPGIVEVIKVIKKYGKSYPSIIIDDFSMIAGKEFRRLSEVSKGWDRYTILNDLMYELMDAVDESPGHVIMTCHEAQPAPEEMVKGGPSLPGKKIRREFGGFPSVLVRTVYDDTFVGPWNYVYQIIPESADYEVGCRVFDMAVPRVASNMGELMRSAGYTIPWPKKLAWMEAAKEELSNKILQCATDSDIEKVLLSTREQLKEYDSRHVRWVIIDSFDRANLKRLQVELVTDYINQLT